MPILRTFISHTGPDLPEHILPLLLQAAPLGVRPWLDKQDLAALVGRSLTEELQAAIGCSQAVTLFLSRRSAGRRWVQKEIEWSLVRPGGRVLPVMLEPLKECWDELPGWVQALFRKHGEAQDLNFLDPRDPDKFLREWTRSFYQAAGVDQAADLVLHLGQRAPEWDAEGNVPADWRDLPVLDVRGPAALVGDKDACPTEAEWRVLRDRLLLMKASLPRLRRLRLCGYVPLSLGSVVGGVFDRGLGHLTLEVHNAYQGRTQRWSSALSPEELRQASAYTPEGGGPVSLEAPAALAGHRGPVLLCLGKVGFDHYLPAVRSWNDGRAEPALPVWARAPAYLNSPEEARAALLGCYGALLYVLRTATPSVVDVVTTLPWTLMALLVHHLRQVGRIRLYDQVMGSGGGYRLALELP